MKGDCCTSSELSGCRDFFKVKVKKLKQPAVGKLWWWITNPLITLLADDWCVSSSLCSVSDDGSMRMSPLVTVYSNGSVKADFQQRLTFACRLNLFLFPFDLQTCYISFSFWTLMVKYTRLTVIIGSLALFCQSKWFGVICYCLHSGLYNIWNDQRRKIPYSSLWYSHAYKGTVGTQTHRHILN